MQTIGLIGGMSWEDSAAYYEALNLGVLERSGGLSSARTVLSSVDYAEVVELQRAERWDTVGRLLAETARGVEKAGADFVLLCTTTFHKVADQVQGAVGIPLLHLADVVADACIAQRIDTVAFLGTSFAMQRSFFTDRLASRDLMVHVPDRRHHAALDSIIVDELVRGQVEERSRKKVVAIIDELRVAGAGGVILGASELELLIHPDDVSLPIFPSTALHVTAALDRALAS